MLDIKDIKSIATITSVQDLEKMNISFEQAYNILEEIVALQRSDNMNLSDGILYYKLGTLISKYCTQILEKATLEIEEISKD